MSTPMTISFADFPASPTNSNYLGSDPGGRFGEQKKPQGSAQAENPHAGKQDGSVRARERENGRNKWREKNKHGLWWQRRRRLDGGTRTVDSDSMQCCLRRIIAIIAARSLGVTLFFPAGIQSKSNQPHLCLHLCLLPPSFFVSGPVLLLLLLPPVLVLVLVLVLLLL